MTRKKTDSLQRALDAAADLFTIHRFEDVAMASIASAAHCSTTTIYDVWGSKEKLFIAAMTARLAQLEIPLPPPMSSRFERLLQWTQQRLRTLSSPILQDVWRAVLRQTELMRTEMTASIQRGRVSGDLFLSEVIGQAMAEGALRQTDPRAIETLVRAVTTHGTLLASLMGDPTMQMAERETLYRLFVPLVTETGRIQLDQFLDSLEPTDAWEPPLRSSPEQHAHL